MRECFVYSTKIFFCSRVNGELHGYLQEVPVYTRIVKRLYFHVMAVATNICLNCEEPIRKGRSDKKFCNPGCKDEYYNAIKIKEGKEINKINGILKNNRRVLQELFDANKSDKKFKREMLIRAGFEFGFLTHVVVTKVKANEITFCFDYGYREIEPQVYQLYHSFSTVQVKDGYEVKVN